MLCLGPNSEANLPAAQNFSTDQRQLSPNLYLMGKYEDLVESESVWWRPCNATHSTHTLAQWSQQYNKCPRQIFLAVARIVDYLHYVFLDGFASEALS